MLLWVQMTDDAGPGAAAARSVCLPQYSGGRLKITTKLTILPSRTLK
jgi:hypothetical protein